MQLAPPSPPLTLSPISRGISEYLNLLAYFYLRFLFFCVSMYFLFCPRLLYYKMFYFILVNCCIYSRKLLSMTLSHVMTVCTLFF